jgi:hypothetical protein
VQVVKEAVEQFGLLVAARFEALDLVGSGRLMSAQMMESPSGDSPEDSPAAKSVLVVHFVLLAPPPQDRPVPRQRISLSRSGIGLAML